MTGTREGTVAGPTGSGRTGTRSSRTTEPVDADLARELLDGLADAVLTTDEAGLVVLRNASAAALLPELNAGTDLAGCSVPALAAAVVDGVGVFEAEHRQRRLRGFRRPLSGGGSAWYVRDVTDEHGRVEALLAERRRTAFLARAGHRLGLTLHRAQALRAAVTLPVPFLADLALIVHLPVLPGDHRPHWIRHTDKQPEPVEEVADWALTTAVPGLAEALDGQATPPMSWLPAAGDGLTIIPAGFDPAATLLVSPMPGAGQVAGALVLLRRAGRAGFEPRDVELAREFAARAGAALALAELYDEQAQLTRVLQTSLLPPRLPRLTGMDFAGGYRAAGDSLRIGGDFYDVLPTTGGALFALGDVAGKGVAAAVLTGRVRQSLQTLRLVEQRPRKLLELLDRALLGMPDAARRSQFTTLLLGTLHPEPDGGLQVRIAGGGHPDPVVLGSDGTVTAVRVGGMPVGALPAARFTEATLRLSGDDVLFAHTDGVIGAWGGPQGTEMFGERRLHQALTSAAGLAPAALVDRILHLLDEWCGGHRHDDVAMLAVGPAARA
ncbi:PP2C family protein-serine/threonine phosphatase [Micromonospora sp. FIMYZ51]|uniref:PP2C family protein-serine/threonine phosphatase n=1 Tax=Micromonospora sp. FIMYZ51 TaxID=3051832 RepID=UPI00311F1B43